MVFRIQSFNVLECPEHGTWSRSNIFSPEKVNQPCPWADYDGWGGHGPCCGVESKYVETIDSDEYYRRKRGAADATG